MTLFIEAGEVRHLIDPEKVCSIHQEGCELIFHYGNGVERIAFDSPPVAKGIFNAIKKYMNAVEPLLF